MKCPGKGGSSVLSNSSLTAQNTPLWVGFPGFPLIFHEEPVSQANEMHLSWKLVCLLAASPAANYALTFLSSGLT